MGSAHSPTDDSGTELELSSHHCLNTIVHVLYEVLLGATEAANIRNVENAVASVRMFTVASTNLYVVLISDALEAWPVPSKVG